MSVENRPGSLWLAAVGTSALLLVLLFTLPATNAPATSAAGAGALRVQLDPETGAIIPLTGPDGAGLISQMEQRLDRSGAGLTTEHHADGSISIDLQGRFQSLAVATVDSAGQVDTGCVTSKRELEQFLNNTQEKE